MDAHPDIGPVEACPLALPPAFATLAPRHAGTSAADVGFAIGAHAVLIVGRMSQSERYKGHDQLLDAWPAVVARVPDAQLLIAGDGDDAPRLRQKAAQTSVADRIHFLGFVPDAMLRALYERAAIFALPSGGEGFGLVYLEAMTHRLPCVGSKTDAASEVIVDGVTGRLVEQRDIAGLADAVATLLIDEAHRRGMGEAGNRRATTASTFDRFSARLRALMHAAEDTHQPATR